MALSTEQLAKVLAAIEAGGSAPPVDLSVPRGRRFPDAKQSRAIAAAYRARAERTRASLAKGPLTRPRDPKAVAAVKGHNRPAR